MWLKVAFCQKVWCSSGWLSWENFISCLVLFTAQDSSFLLRIVIFPASNFLTKNYLFLISHIFSKSFSHPLHPSLCISSNWFNQDLKQNSSNFSHSAQCCPKEAFYGDILVCNFCTLGLDNALFVTSFLGHWWFCTFACISSVYFFLLFFQRKN